MRKSLTFYALLMCITMGLSFSTFGQQASTGHKEKTAFLNPLAECTGTGELIYDDGTFENGYGWNAAVVNQGIITMMFTPTEYPWQFNTFCVSLTQNATNNLTFDLVIYDDDGTAGGPGTILSEITGLTATNIPGWPTLAWYDFDISASAPIESGSVYVGVRWNDVPAYPGTFIGSDESTSTTLQPGYNWNDNAGTWSTNESLWPEYRAMGMRTLGEPAVPCDVENPTNPNPADLAEDVDVNIGSLTWTNGANTTANEVYFGEYGNMTLVYDGAAVTSYSVGTLDYNTRYQWSVRCKNDSCGRTSTWSFTTMQDPNLITLMMEDFESGLTNWTNNTTGGCGWEVFTDPAITGRYTLPGTAGGGILAADADNCGSSGGGASGEVTYTSPIDASQYMSVSVEWDNDWQAINTSDFGYVDVSTDGGSTWQNVVTFDDVDVRNTHEYYDISSMVGGQAFILRFVSVQPAWDWWWAVDNVQVTGWDIVPVELSSFTANVSENNVVLNWTTATETNNKGFEVQRSNGGEYQTLGFVQGNGTSTQSRTYTYSDKNVTEGQYTYRLKQVDFDGTSKYSNTVELSVEQPKVYSLTQNYPNPFNPTTQINFSLAADSKVTLKVFDILGQEVATLLNGSITAGMHNVTFDASHLNSGVYLYKIEANGVDGSNFTSVKKMILTK